MLRAIADHSLEMTYMCQPPKRWTFEQPKLKQWVEDWCRGLTLNLFAGKVELDVDEVRVDLDSQMKAHVCMDAFEFVEGMKSKALYFPNLILPFTYDTVVLDPPYNIRKAREKYNGNWIGKFTKIKNILPDIINPGGHVITLGYDTVGMSKSRGFEKIGICVVCHNGDHNDTLVLVERKI